MHISINYTSENIYSKDMHKYAMNIVLAFCIIYEIQLI